MGATGNLLTREVTLDSFKAAIARFLAWEHDEFLAVLPPAVLAWLLGRGAREAVVKAGASDLVSPAGSGASELRIRGQEIAATSLDAALERRGLSRKSLAIVLEMPSKAFLIRQFDAPTAALPRLPFLLQSEIERRTPFRSEDVLAGSQILPHEEKGKAKVRLALVRRDLIAPALEPSGLTIGDLAGVRAEAEPGGADQPQVIAVNDGERTDRRFHRIALAMAAAAALLVVAGIGATFWRQSAEAEALDARIADMSARAAKVRQIADRASQEGRLLAALHERRTKVAPLTELWEEISRLMPDSAFLTDFHLTESKSGERNVDLAGFAQSAVGLPLLFDHSKYFLEAALTAPITSDPREKRESFSLRLKVRALSPPAASERQEKGR